jgi:hypothetical protein
MPSEVVPTVSERATALLALLARADPVLVEEIPHMDGESTQLGHTQVWRVLDQQMLALQEIIDAAIR